MLSTLKVVYIKPIYVEYDFKDRMFKKFSLSSAGSNISMSIMYLMIIFGSKLAMAIIFSIGSKIIDE